MYGEEASAQMECVADVLGHAVPVPVPQMLGPFPVAACGRWLYGSCPEAALASPDAALRAEE